MQFYPNPYSQMQNRGMFFYDGPLCQHVPQGALADRYHVMAMERAMIPEVVQQGTLMAQQGPVMAQQVGMLRIANAPMTGAQPQAASQAAMSPPIPQQLQQQQTPQLQQQVQQQVQQVQQLQPQQLPFQQYQQLYYGPGDLGRPLI